MRTAKIKTADQFRRWLFRHGLTQEAAATLFELSRRMIIYYTSPLDPRPIPKILTMALWAHDRGYKPERQAKEKGGRRARA